MNKQEIIFELKKQYSFREIGKLFKCSRQNINYFYQKYRNEIKDVEKKTCDVCGIVSKKVKPHENVKVCPDCWKEIEKVRRRKGKHSI